MVWKKGASVAIWGSGLNAEKVYVKYAGKYDIQIVVDNFKTKERVFNKKIVSAEEFFANEKYRELKIIIASDKWKEISEQLRSMGLCVGEDFLPYIMLDTREILVTQLLEICYESEVENFLDKIKGERKILIFWGNCQINGVREFCKNNKEFCERYMIVSFPNLWNKEALLKCCEYEKIWKQCEVLVVQNISKNNAFNINFSSEHRKKYLELCNENSRVVELPNLHFEGYWPQFGTEVVYALKNVQWEGVVCRDANIIRMVDEKMSDEEIIKKCEDENCYSVEAVLDHFNKCLLNFKNYEKNCDVCISDFLKQNKILYYSPFHPRVEVVYELALRLLRYLNIKDIKVSNRDRIKEYLERISYFHRTEYIYPSVIKAIGDDIYMDYQRINTYIYNTTITGREMLESYIAICKGYRE